MSRGAAPASLLFLLAACAAPAPRRADPGELASAVSVQEIPDREDPIAIPSTAHRAPIGHLSKVRVAFDRTRLQELASRFGRQDVVPAPGPEELAQREGARRLLDALPAYLEDAAETERLVGEFRRDPARAAELQARIAARAANVEPAVQLAQALAKAEVRREGRAKGWTLEADAKDRFTGAEAKARYQALAKELLPDGVKLDGPALGRLVEAHLGPVVDRAKEALDRAESLARLGFRARAYLVKPGAEKPLPIHCENYDSIEAGIGPEPKKGPWGISEKDWERLEERLEIASRAATLVNELRVRGSALREELRRLRKDVKEDVGALLQSLRGLLPASWSAETLKEAVDWLRANAGALGIGPETLAALDKLPALAAEVRQAVDALLALVEPLRSALEGGEIPRIPDALQALQTLAGKAKELAGAAKALYDGLAKAADAEALRSKAAELLGRLGQTARGELERRLGELKTFPRLFDALSFFRDAAAKEAAQGRFDENVRLGADPRSFARRLGEVTDTEFSLSGLPTEQGDRIAFRAELLEGTGASDRVLLGHAQEFVVDVLGIRPRLDAHVIFVERLKEPGGGIPKTNYEASPSASWTLHWRVRNHLGGETWPSLWNGLDLGVGIGVAALNFENDGVEVGGGVHASIFGDLLQVGFGLNGNVDDERGYWYVGVGIVELLNVAGLGARALGGP